MRSPSTPFADLARRAAFVVFLLAGLAACGGSTTPTAGGPRSAPASGPTDIATASLPTPVPTPPGATARAAASLPLQSEVEWGRIWDGIPPSFPTVPGSTTSEIGSDASATLIVPATVEAATTFMQSALERAGYSTEALSGPLEDGSMVLDSVGPTTTDCRVETKITPLGGTTTMTVYFGAACPFE